VGRLNALYKGLERLQAERNEIFNRVEYKVVKRKNEKDHARYLNLCNLSGTNQEALDLLEEQANDWMRNPSNFWTHPEPVNTRVPYDLPHLSSQAQIVGHYLQGRRGGA